MKISICKYSPKLVENKLDKRDAMMQCVKGFKRYDVNDLQELYKLVNKNVVYAPVYFKDNYRKIENAILEIDMLIFDIDNGMTMDEVCESKLGRNYECLLLKTASWTPELEKFRIFVSLSETIKFTNAEEYREFYKIIADYYGLQCDSQVMEAGRGYIAVRHKDAIITPGNKILNLSTSLTKIRSIIKRKLLQQKILQEKKDEELKRYRLINNIKVPTPMQIQDKPKWKSICSELSSGNHFKPVYKLLGYCKYMGQTESEAVESVMLLNIGGEYSNPKDLAKKFRRAK